MKPIPRTESDSEIHARGGADKKKPRIHYEQVKARHTSHWDWDYMPHSELEKLLQTSESPPDRQHTDPAERIRKINLLTALIGMALGLAAIVSGIYYLSR